MMHHCCCGSSQGHVMGTCTCGMYHSEASSYGSMLFSVPNNSEYDMYSSFTPSPSSVDCTLSLGTPSTRLTQDDDHDNDNKRHRHQRRSGVTNFCWDMLHSKHNNNNNMQSQSKSSSRGSSNNNNDPLLARRCANCDTTSTPLWRNGPRGPKSLCNACGIRFKKEERRASAAAATSAAVPGGEMDSARLYGHHHNSWYDAHSQSQKMMMGNELRFMDDSEDRDSENNGIPFLSWKLNVPDRTSLVDERW